MPGIRSGFADGRCGDLPRMPPHQMPSRWPALRSLAWKPPQPDTERLSGTMTHREQSIQSLASWRTPHRRDSLAPIALLGALQTFEDELEAKGELVAIGVARLEHVLFGQLDEVRVQTRWQVIEDAAGDRL